MRPKRKRPTGVMYSPHTRLTATESARLFFPAVGAHWVVVKAPSGAYPPRSRTR